MNNGDNDDSPSTRAFVERERRLQKAAEAIAVLGLTPRLEAELADCRREQMRIYNHDFIIDSEKWR